MTVAQYLARQLRAWGVDTFFGVPGDTVLPLLEALRAEEGVRWIACRHEAAAALAASAYAKASGRMAACVADGGPGAVQLLNGVYDARRDRVPMFVVTGQLARTRMGTGWPQDADPGLAYRGTTVFGRTLCHPAQLPEFLRAAFRAARHRPGPVRLSVPEDLWQQPVQHPHPGVASPAAAPPPAASGRIQPDTAALEQAARTLQHAQRPAILVGQGARAAASVLAELASDLDAAVVHTLPALGVIPFAFPLNLGVAGEFGTQAAANALAQADAVLMVGTTWRQPGYLNPSAKLIQVDCSMEHLGIAFDPAPGIWGAAEEVVPALRDELARLGRKPRPAWRSFIEEQRRRWEQEIASVAATAADGALHGPAGPAAFPEGAATLVPERAGAAAPAAALHPGLVARLLGDHVTDDAIIAVDSGNHTFWFARYFRARHQRILLSGHWRTVGFALPAALGAKLAQPARQVVAFCGDGGFAMHLAELTTAVAHGLAIACVVLRDDRFGEEESLQRSRGLAPFGTRLRNPDFAAVARACGAHGYTASNPAELESALRAVLPALARGEVGVVEAAVQRVDPLRPQPLPALAAPAWV
ncbi:MAG TPA: thiamine pyrophosphate-binding protein [Limnochordales bacterium]